MSTVDHLARAFLLVFFVWNQVIQYPVPLPLVDRQTISAAFEDFTHGTCPFSVSPAFGKADYHLDKYRRISYNYHNTSLIMLKAIYYFENEVGRDPTTFVENLYQQLTMTIPATMSQGFFKRVINIFLISMSAYFLYNSCQLDSLIERSPKECRIISYVATKTIFIFYVVGQPDPAVDSTGHFYFFLTLTTTFGCMNAAIIVTSYWFEKLLINNELSTFSRLGLFCVPFSTLLAAFLMITFCHVNQIDISGIYTLFIVLDSLILATRAWYLLTRISIGGKEQEEQTGHRQFLFKMLVIYIGDLLEVISTFLSIFFGLFIRKRLMALLLISHGRRLLQRILLFEYPAISELAPELKLALI